MVALDDPAAVSSGHTLHHHLTVHDLTGSELQIAANGRVTAAVVDPQTGETVGGFSGIQTLPLKVFRAISGGSMRIPLLIGTASSRPSSAIRSRREIARCRGTRTAPGAELSSLIRDGCESGRRVVRHC